MLFRSPVGTRGDNFDRYLMRMEEMKQSDRILRQCFQKMEPGDIAVRDFRYVLPPKPLVYGTIEGVMAHFKLVMEGIQVPAGEVYSYTEAANGELGFYLVSDGGGRPYKIGVRAPGWPMTAALGHMVKGALLDAPGSWFVLEEYPTYEYVSAQVRFIEKVMRLQLERSQFVDEYMKALEEGFLLGSGCLKLYWDDWIDRGPQLVDIPTGQYDPMTGMPQTFPMVQSAPRPRNGLKIRQVPVLSMYPDPFARTFNDAKWVVEELAVDEEELRDGHPEARRRVLQDLRADGRHAADRGQPLLGDRADEAVLRRLGRSEQWLRRGPSGARPAGPRSFAPGCTGCRPAVTPACRFRPTTRRDFATPHQGTGRSPAARSRWRPSLPWRSRAWSSPASRRAARRPGR